MKISCTSPNMKIVFSVLFFLSVNAIHNFYSPWLERQFEKKQRKGKCMHFFIKSIFDYNSKKNPVNTPNDEQLVEAFTFICEDTVV